MLLTLSIRDMVLIETAELRFRPGLNVLTGETGAGKSILLDALGFGLGWRTRAELVRAGADEGEVVASFALSPGHPARAILEEAGLPGGDELILRRTVGADGRRQAFVNDRRAAAETLRRLSDTLIELHGQQDDRGLLDPRGHRRLLDAFAGAGEAVAASRAAWRARADAERALAEAEARLAAARRDEDYLAHAVAELEALDPASDEEPGLDARRRTLRAAERIAEDVGRAAAALGPEGAEGPLLDALRWIEGANAAADGALDATLAAVERTLTELGTAADALVEARAGLVGDPGELERVEERLFAIRGLARKHNVTPDTLAALAADLRARFAEIATGDDAVRALRAALAAADAQWRAAAGRLSALRTEAAGRLNARMAEELAPLRLGRAVFFAEVTPGEPGPEGADRVRFTAATIAGAEPGPIEKVASGGELSRFLLALKVCLSDSTDAVTLIFDEIDRGVGGATADAVGRRLRALGEAAQVLVVTHSPQVAAQGAHHWRVGKRGAAEDTRTEVVALDAAARVDEIGRMLAGDRITSEARAAAKALLSA